MLLIKIIAIVYSTIIIIKYILEIHSKNNFLKSEPVRLHEYSHINFEPVSSGIIIILDVLLFIMIAIRGVENLVILMPALFATGIRLLNRNDSIHIYEDGILFNKKYYLWKDISSVEIKKYNSVEIRINRNKFRRKISKNIYHHLELYNEISKRI